METEAIKPPSAVPKPSKSLTRWALAACALALVVFGTLSWLATADRCATLDETQHLAGAWVQRQMGDFRCDPENPPLWRSYFLLGIPDDDLRLDTHSANWDRMLDGVDFQGEFILRTLFDTPGNNVDPVLRAARQRMLAVGLLLGGLVSWWAWRLRGAVAGVVAGAAFALDPNFLAHSSLVKNDVAMALALFAWTISLWLIGRKATLLRWLAMSVLMAIAFNTKFSAVITVPVLLAAVMIRALGREPWLVLGRTISTRPGRIAAAALLSTGAFALTFLSIWACYEFRFEMSSDPAKHFNQDWIVQRCAQREVLAAHGAPKDVSPAQLQQWVSQWRPSAGVRVGMWLLHHRVLPEAWIVGNLHIYSGSLIRDSFLDGQFSSTGWWYYFPLAMLYKTPVAALVGLAAALVLWIFRRKLNVFAASHSIVPAILMPAMFMAMAMNSHLNLGLRHVLPVYPFLFVFLGAAAAEACRRFGRAGIVFVVTLVVGLGVETLAAFPNYIPFFNAVASLTAPAGERGGIQLLSDSNLDWGQDVKLLAQWQAANPDKPLYWEIFSGVDPQHYGVKPPVSAQTPSVWRAYSATYLQGTYATGDQRDEMATLRRTKPYAILGGSIFIFPPQAR